MYWVYVAVQSIPILILVIFTAYLLEKIRRLEEERDKRVLCFFCKKPIHIDRFAGIFKVDKKTVLFCDNIVCLIEFLEHYDRRSKK